MLIGGLARTDSRRGEVDDPNCLLERFSREEREECQQSFKCIIVAGSPLRKSPHVSTVTMNPGGTLMPIL
jgi:hypothetical protein